MIRWPYSAMTHSGHFACGRTTVTGMVYLRSVKSKMWCRWILTIRISGRWTGSNTLPDYSLYIVTNLPGVIWCGSMSAGMRNSGLCAGNKLEELVVDGLRNLSRVDCAANNLEKLDLQNLPVLTFLLCRNNRLCNLDFSETPGLKSIDCANNGISALDVRPCGDITMIWCEGNAGMRISLDWRQAPGIFGDDDVVLEVAEMKTLSLPMRR